MIPIPLCAQLIVAIVAVVATTEVLSSKDED